MSWFGRKKEEPKKQIRQETCGHCGGACTVTCPECGGSGETGGSWHFKCSTCDGSGEVICPGCSGLGYTEEED